MKRGTPDHPKMLLLASLLGLPKWGAVGIMESVWQFAARYSPCGDIGKYPDEMIAVGIGWTDDAKRLIKALIESKWLDMSGQVRLYVHDWHDHADDYADKHLSRHGLTYANGAKPRRSEGQNPPRGGKRRTKAEKSRVSVSVSESVSESVSVPQNDATHGDEVYQFLVEHEPLKCLTYEQDLIARRQAGWDIRDREGLMKIAPLIADAAVLMGQIDSPGSWLAKQYEKNKKAAAPVVVDLLGGEHMV